VCEFLRFCARTGLVEPIVAERLSEPRWLRLPRVVFTARTRLAPPGSTESVADFAARARPFPRAQDCLVAGCAREQVTRRGLCRFHDNRYLRTDSDRRADGGLAAWVAAAQPRLGGHQFCLAGLGELVGVEALYALQQRDLSPLPLDPMQVRILLTPEAVCESGGVQYNSTTRTGATSPTRTTTPRLVGLGRSPVRYYS